MARMETLTASDGHHFSAYVSLPAGSARAAIVLLQEFFGVNGHIRRVADDFARDGYAVIAPAIFDRVERDVELGYDDKGMARGRQLRASLALDDIMRDEQAAIDHAARYGRVAALGYCWGGSLAFLGATRLHGLACAVGYYGAQIASHAEEATKVPVLLHYAEIDEYIPQADIEKTRALHPEIIIYQYPGSEHGFNCDDRQFYEPVNAALARQRTIEFINKHTSSEGLAKAKGEIR
jgi:carboxymethylenebutenolidase